MRPQGRALFLMHGGVRASPPVVVWRVPPAVVDAPSSCNRGDADAMEVILLLALAPAVFLCCVANFCNAATPICL